MSIVTPEDALAQLTASLRAESIPASGAGLSTRLAEATSNNVALRNAISLVRETAATERQIAIDNNRRMQEQAQAQAEAQAAQQRRVTGILAQADSQFLSGRSAEERAAVRGTPLEAAFRENALADIAEEFAGRDLTVEANLDALSAVQLAQAQARGTRLQSGLSDQDVGQFAEAYANRNQSDFNPLSFLRNVAGSAVSGIAGAADLGLSAVGLGALGSPIGDIGGQLGEFIDDTSLGTTIFQERLANSGAEGFGENAAAAIDNLSAGAAVGLGSDLLGLLAGGGPIAAGVRGAARAAGAGQRINQAGRFLQGAGTPALLAGAGQDFAQNGVDDGALLSGDRTAQAATQLLGTLGLGAASGLPGVGALVGGVERAAAQGGVRGALGGQLAARTTPIRAGTRAQTAQNVAGEVAQRAGAGAVGAARQGVSEGTQEVLEALVSQGALSVGTGQNQFDADELGQSAALGAVLGGGLGAGRALQNRAAPLPLAPQGPPDQRVQGPPDLRQPSELDIGQRFAGPPIALGPDNIANQQFNVDLGTANPGPAGVQNVAGQNFDVDLGEAAAPPLRVPSSVGTAPTPNTILADDAFITPDAPTLTAQPAAPGSNVAATPTQTVDTIGSPAVASPTAIAAPQGPVAVNQPTAALAQTLQQAPTPNELGLSGVQPALNPTFDPALPVSTQATAQSTGTDTARGAPIETLPSGIGSGQLVATPAPAAPTPAPESLLAPATQQAVADVRGGSVGLGINEEIDVPQDAPITLSTLQDTVSRSDLATARRQARILLQQGEYTLQDIQDTSVFATNDALASRFEQRFAEEAQALSEQAGSTVPEPNAPARTNEVALTRRRENLASSVQDLQAQGDFEQVSAVQAEIADIDQQLQLLRDTAVEQESVRQVQQARQNAEFGALPGEPEAAALRPSRGANEVAVPTDNQVGSNLRERVQDGPNVEPVDAPQSQQASQAQQATRTGATTSTTAASAPTRSDLVAPQVAPPVVLPSRVSRSDPAQNIGRDYLSQLNGVDNARKRSAFVTKAIEASGVTMSRPERAVLNRALARQVADAQAAIDANGLAENNTPNASRSDSARSRRVRPASLITDGVLSDTSSTDSGNANARTPQLLGATAIRAEVSKTIPGFPFEVIEDAGDITPEFEQVLINDTGAGWDNDVKAVLYGDRIYLNAGAITDSVDLEVTLAHEILGHAGLRALHGPDLSGHLDEITHSYGGVDGLLLAADRMGLGAIRQNYADIIARAQARPTASSAEARVLAEELVVSIVESEGLDAQRAGIIDRLGAQVRSWLRSNFPRLARAMNLTYADWELAVLAGEASHAGRALLDNAQPINTARAFASRRVPLTEQIRGGLDPRVAEARQLMRNLVDGDVPIQQRTAGLVDNVRTRGVDVREGSGLGTETNFYNRFVQRWVDDKRGLKNTTRRIRRSLASDGRIVARIAQAVVDAPTSSKITIDPKNGDVERSVITTFFNNIIPRNLDPEATNEYIRDKAAIAERSQFAGAQAEIEHDSRTQVLLGDFRAALSTMSSAITSSEPASSSNIARRRRGASQKEAYELIDDHRRDLHTIERNEAFAFDFTKSGSELNTFIGKENVDALSAIRKRTRATDSTVLEPDVAFRMERDLILDNIKPEQIDAFDKFRFSGVQTTGPDSTTQAAEARIAKRALSASEQAAFDQATAVLDRYLELDQQVKEEYGAYSQNYSDQIQRYGFRHYSPQWVKNNANNDEFSVGQSYHDPLLATFKAARGTELETTSPIASILTMVGRTFHDKHDNGLVEDVITLWAAAQDTTVATAVGPEWADGTLRLVRKNTRGYDELKASAKKNEFVMDLSQLSPELQAATSRQENNQAFKGSPSNYAVVLTYPEAIPNGARKRDANPIPDLVKGKRERNDLVERLRASDSFAANVISGGARTLGSFHTKYNPAWPVIQLVRDTQAAFLTISAEEGFSGARSFIQEGLPAVYAITPKLSSYVYHADRPGATSAAKVAALRADPELEEFFSFVDSGAPTPFARSTSLNTRMDEMVGDLRTRGFTPTELEQLGDLDRGIAALSTMGDIMGRYAAYKTLRSRGFSTQEAASQARGIADFSQRGESRHAEMGAMMYMFFRSAMIGATQIIDTLLASRYNLETLGIATGVAGSMFGLAAAMSPEDEEGNNLFLTQGSSTTHFKFFIDEDTVLQIPFAYNGYSAAGAIALQSLFGATGNQSMATTAGNMLDVVANNVSPVSNNIGITDAQGDLSITQLSKKIFDMASPALAGPALTLALNTDNFGNPVVPGEGSLGDPGPVGAVFDSTGGQVGGFAEVFSRSLFEATNGFLAPSVRQIDEITDLAAGPKRAIENVMEIYRLATGRDYSFNIKKGLTPLAGLIGTPHNSAKSRYYELVNQLEGIDRSERILQRSGATPEEASAQMQAIVGAEAYARVQQFKLRSNELRTLSTQIRDVRLNNVLTSAERLTAYRRLSKEHDARVGALIRDLR